MLQRILEFSIGHRRGVVLAVLLLALVGVRALSQLPIDAVPDVTNKQVQINVEAPALSPLEIERQITFVLETAVLGVPGMRSTRSLSRHGFCQITAVFDDATDIYFARQQIGERLREAGPLLPDGVEPKLGPIATGLGEVCMWSLTYKHPRGEGAHPHPGDAGWQGDGSYRTDDGELLRSDVELAGYLRTVQDWIVRPQLRIAPGLAGVESIGGHQKQYHVHPDPERLAAFGLSFRDVIEALEQANVNTGAGFVERHGETHLVRAAGRIERPEELAEIVVGAHANVPIRLSSVLAAEGVRIGPELRTGAATQNGEEMVLGTALMLLGGNSRAVAAEVQRRLAGIAAALPPDIALEVLLDRSTLVDATITTVWHNLAEGALLVVVVLLFLLGNLRAALIAALAIPLSMLFTAAGMVELGVSGNLMSLGAIDFGLIVDGAVIIVENCLRRLAERQRELGRPLTLPERLQTTQQAAGQVRSATAFGEAIIIIVYLPILSLQGVEGKMFQPMAMTVVLALVAAFVLSLTLVPALVALLLRSPLRLVETWPVRAAKALYAPVLRFSLQWRFAVMGCAALLFVAALGLFRQLGREFVPTLDEQNLAVQVSRIASTSLSQAVAMEQEVERVLKAMPEVAVVFSKTGSSELATDPMPPNVSDAIVVLKPRAEWPDPGLPKAELVARMDAALQLLPGNRYLFTQPIEMRFQELVAGVRSDLAVRVHGEDFVAMELAARTVALRLMELPGAADVMVEQTDGLPLTTVRVDRTAAGRYGLTVAEVQDVVAVAVGGRVAGSVQEGDRRVDLVVRLPEALRADPGRLADLPVPLPRRDAPDEPHANDDAPLRGYLPLASVASLDVRESQNQVTRLDGKRCIVVRCNVRGTDLGTFVRQAQQALADVALPAGGWLGYGGQFENLVAAEARLWLLVPLCLLLILVLLCASFGDLRDALLVFSGVPLGLSGGVLALVARGMPFSISAAVGFIALSGVAVLNGLVMISCIRELRQQGAGLAVAIEQGALQRLRPVLTTALVASLGFLPMAWSTGVGAEVQRPLATVVVGGLLTSTLLTLMVLPALYRQFAKRTPAMSG